MTRLQVGDKAPKFELADQDGQSRKLGDFKGQHLLIYFYPKANTPGCTTQSCEVQAALPNLKRAGAAVVGISPDKPSAQKKFADKFKLTFPLLADEDHAVAKSYGVWGEKSMYGKKYMGIIRSAFLVDPKGKIAAVWYGVSPKDTAPEALKALA